MNSSIIAVDIIPDNDGRLEMYGEPNKDKVHLVSGKLRVILSKPLKVKFISVKLKGKTEYSDWENQYSCINIIKLEQILYEKDVLPRGVADFDFELRVPGNLPQSYVTGFGLIRYKLIAEVQPSSMLAKCERVERGIHIYRHYLPCRRELLPAPPTKVYRGQRRNILKYELDIPTVISVNERSLLIRVRLLPFNEEGYVKKIIFDLVQSEKYRVQPSQQDIMYYEMDNSQFVGNVQLNGSTPTKRKRSSQIKPTVLSISRDDDTWNNPLTYNLPFVQYSRNATSDTARASKLKATIDSPLIRVRHKLRLSMIFKDESEKDLELGFPITITTIPEDDHSSIFGMLCDNSLPSYDDCIEDSPTMGYEESEDSRPITPLGELNNLDNILRYHSRNNSRSNSRNHSRSNSRNHSRSNSRNHSRSNSRDNSRSNSRDRSISNSRNNSRSNTMSNLDDVNNAYNYDNSSNGGNNSISSDKRQPTLKHKRSLVDRLLHRNENNSKTPPPIPSIPIVYTKSTSHPNYNNLNVSQLDNNRALPITSQDPPSYSSMRSPNSNINYLSARNGGANRYLNMPDEDDYETNIHLEIRSAPSSPKLSGIAIPLGEDVPNELSYSSSSSEVFNRENNNNLSPQNMKRKSHRRSASFDLNIKKPDQINSRFLNNNKLRTSGDLLGLSVSGININVQMPSPTFKNINI
ncbi:8302_t:CDS:2 [Gigaspora margarita]|uniref:8302_t:CDS:1 n=1 Tax=Gigaspora margarita TaxID=4874 RepID=A0ABN7UDM8_GIGMA|nr:8302_t:CDS:2 [Gigaspora margarita]